MSYTAKIPHPVQRHPRSTLLLNKSPSKEGGLLVVYTLNEIWWRFLTKRYNAPTAPLLIQNRTKTKAIPGKKVNLFWDPRGSICFLEGEYRKTTCRNPPPNHQQLGVSITIKFGTAVVLLSWHKWYEPKNFQN